MKTQYLLKLLTVRNFNTTFSHLRYFSENLTRFSENQNAPSNSHVIPFSQPTDETNTFLDSLLHRDLLAIDQLNHTIEDGRVTIRIWNNEADLTIDRSRQIEGLMNIIQTDIQERDRHLQSAEIIGTIIAGVEPPVNNMNGWITLRDDLDNSPDPGLDDLRDYVRNTLDIHMTNPWLQEMAELMRTHRVNLPEDRSRDNSQVDDSSSIDESDSMESDSSIYHSANSNFEDSDSSSESESEDYKSVDSNQYKSDSDDSDSDNYPPGNSRGSNSNNNQILTDNPSISESCDNQGSNESANNDSSNTNNQSECNISSDKKLITDDAPDLSDSFKILFADPPIENKSTIDFILQKQQEEMPDIIDSDGGE